MNKIEELNVKLEKAFHSAQKLENQIRCIQEEIKNFEKKQEKPKFKRANYGKIFYTLCFINGALTVGQLAELNDLHCDECFESNNYFLTEERAQEVADKMNFLLRMERLHDEMCPDYQPDWKKSGIKYCVLYSESSKKFNFCRAYYDFRAGVYFPTEIDAIQACDILNAELEQTKE